MFWILGMKKDTNHIVVEEWSTLLYESRNAKCQILNGPLMDWTTEFCEPAAPSLSPDGWFVRLVRGESITIETIACVYLPQMPQKYLLNSGIDPFSNSLILLLIYKQLSFKLTFAL